MRRLLAEDVNTPTIGAVADWIDELRQQGPPSDGVQVWEDDELYLARVPRTDLICRYFVVVYERLVALDRFDRS